MNKNSVFIAQLLASACFAAPAFAQAPAPAAPASTAPPASAADSAGAQLQEVVVTAQRQSQPLQKVPIAVSAVSGSELVARGVTNSSSLSEVVPNLNITQNGTTLSLYLRGVGSNASDPNDESSVATYVDGVYIASPLANLFSFNNISQIEVLKGPQGTLFGRNATAGVIQVITKDPSQTPQGQAQITYGNYNTVGANFYGTTGITQNIAADLAAVYNENFNGYGEDLNRHVEIFKREDLGLRSKILWTPSATTQVRLEGDYSLVRSDGTNYQLAQGVIGADGVSTYPGRYNTDTNEANAANSVDWGFSLHVNHDFDFARFVSISAFRHVNGTYDLDEDSTPVPVVNSFISQVAQNYSQEFQLLSEASSRIQWVAGLYYFNATYGYVPITIGGLAAPIPPATNIFGTQHTFSYSAYGQATVPLVFRTKFTGGIRYTYEKQDELASITADGLQLETAPEQHQDFSKPTWRLALDHDFTQNILGYVSYNRGIKSGGYNLLGPGAPGYKPEILDAYEVGVKSEFLHHTVRANVAGFYYKYKDIQVQNIQGGAANTLNAAAADVKGVDADISVIPVRNLTLSSGLGYIYAVYTNFPNAVFTPPSPLDGPQYSADATGNFLINTSRYTANLSADYKIPTEVGSFLFDLTGAFRSKSYVDADNRLAIPGYTVVNTSLNWTSMDEVYGVRLWARNLLDRHYYADRTETAVGDIQYLAPPRTFGFTLSRKF